MARCGKKLASFPGLHTVQFVIICKRSKTGRWEGLGTRSLLHNFIHKRLLTTPGHFQSPSQYIQSATPSHFLPVEGNTQLLLFASAVSTHNFVFINDLSPYRPITLSTWDWVKRLPPVPLLVSELMQPLCTADMQAVENGNCE